MSILLITFGGVLYIQSSVYFVYQKSLTLIYEKKRLTWKHYVFIGALIYIFLDLYIIQTVIYLIQLTTTIFILHPVHSLENFIRIESIYFKSVSILIIGLIAHFLFCKVGNLRNNKDE